MDKCYWKYNEEEQKWITSCGLKFEEDELRESWDICDCLLNVEMVEETLIAKNSENGNKERGR